MEMKENEQLYRQLPTPIDLSISAVEWAAVSGLPPAYVFELHVPPHLVPTANLMCRQMGATTQGNPLAPYVNVVADERLKRYEWFIKSGDVSIGSSAV
jgi:hypothetical protein